MGCGASATQKYAADDTIEFLHGIPAFENLSDEDFKAIAGASKIKDLKDDTAFITQGDAGTELFVIKTGQAAVIVDGKEVAKLGPKEHVGEASLLKGAPRNATVKAVGPIQVIVISQAEFIALGLHDKLVFKKRAAVGGGGHADHDVQVETPCSKSDAENKLIRDALAHNSNLRCFYDLTQRKCEDMAAVMWKQKAASGEETVKMGDDVNVDHFYIILSGSFTVTGKSKSGAPRNLGILKKGESFGELALMYKAPRAATIKANEASELFVIDRVQFRNILAKSSPEQIIKRSELLGRVPLFEKLDRNERLELAQAMTEVHKKSGETIFNKGDKGNLCYVLVDGAIEVNVHQGGDPIILEKDSCFGELALMNDEPRAATVKTIRNCTLLQIDKPTFIEHLGELKDIQGRGGNDDRSAMDRGPSQEARQFGVIKFKDLKKIGLLGCGGFGAVDAVERVSVPGEVYALKALSKGYVMKMGMHKSVISEKDIQLKCNSPFIVKLFETYNNDQALLLLLEIAIGGELYATYNRKNLWGKVDHAKYYVAGTVLAFEHLHSKHIVFRDLKPENLLLNNLGEVKLTDMGLAKDLAKNGMTHTTCGTPDYFAPEIIAAKGHGPAVDWWTLGILAFELLVGRPPFESPTPQQIYQKVKAGIEKVRFPENTKGSAERLIKGLCSPMPAKRLPMRDGKINNIKNAQWYKEKGFEWEKLQACSFTPPYVPKVKANTDLANFKARPEDKPPNIPYKPLTAKDPRHGWDDGFATST